MGRKIGDLFAAEAQLLPGDAFVVGAELGPNEPGVAEGRATTFCIRTGPRVGSLTVLMLCWRCAKTAAQVPII
ncbi:MAG TPA: hypothetical protein VMU89_24980 [Thermomicrobiaceae bacterium]|nr:hypothetical protein [Thermomicrobiaceae bacterium]